MSTKEAPADIVERFERIVSAALYSSAMVEQADIEAVRAALSERAAVPEAVAIVAEVHMSRYTIEWTNGPLPEGTRLYAQPPAERAALSERAAPESAERQAGPNARGKPTP